MIVTVLLNKIKSLLLIFANLFRRALCCFRRRRRSSCDTVPLTHVISNSEQEGKAEFQNWGEWEDCDSKPKTVQDHIELYRKQAEKLKQQQDAPDSEEQLNFFEDMAPKITRQTKVLIDTGHCEGGGASNRLNFIEDAVSVVPSLELREWEETSGWEGENLDHDAQKALREKRGWTARGEHGSSTRNGWRR
ncbi:hypothetical protein NQ318_006804 [Aromia moschata]|uniref:Receptor-binding cancer antigen expressed on SiSo cells n=1 Tax=Aromia moschata TaxID=1265417 RepID=A0AAV8XQU1_9CUCU|nr:hypothetical protein NQ318_006804 [Aromia moschata]